MQECVALTPRLTEDVCMILGAGMRSPNSASEMMHELIHKLKKIREAIGTLE